MESTISVHDLYALGGVKPGMIAHIGSERVFAIRKNTVLGGKFILVISDPSKKNVPEARASVDGAEKLIVEGLKLKKQKPTVKTESKPKPKTAAAPKKPVISAAASTKGTKK